MGKPSKRLSRHSSNISLSSKNNMKATHKASQTKHRHKNKVDDTIKNLFKELRRQSISRLNSSRLEKPCETSVIEIDDSGLNDSVMCASPLVKNRTGNSNTIKPVLTNKPKDSENQVKTIIIDEQSTPRKRFSLHHSTPIKENPLLDKLLLDVDNQTNEDQNNNKTREINASSFLTIDLTTESRFNRSSSSQLTVIDLDNTDNQDCVLTSVSQSSSMSGDSDVTVLHRPTTARTLTRQIKTGLACLNPSEKDKILQFISENLLNGCSIPAKIPPRARESAENTYIKEVIVGTKLSRNSIGSNIYNPEEYVNTSGLRMIVIDGSNVAMAHGKSQFFSVPGLKIVIDYFLSRGHVVKAFVPRFRNKTGKSSHPMLLTALERAGHVIFTPSREVHGYDISSYDDRYIIQCAAEFHGIIVSNDRFRDLVRENRHWEYVIRNRVLQFTWVNGMIMFPKDPLGKNGPKLENFLKMSPDVHAR